MFQNWHTSFSIPLLFADFCFKSGKIQYDKGNVTKAASSKGSS